MSRKHKKPDSGEAGQAPPMLIFVVYAAAQTSSVASSHIWLERCCLEIHSFAMRQQDLKDGCSAARDEMSPWCAWRRAMVASASAGSRSEYSFSLYANPSSITSTTMLGGDGVNAVR